MITQGAWASGVSLKCTSNNISDFSNLGTYSKLKLSKTEKKCVFPKDIHDFVEQAMVINLSTMVINTEVQYDFKYIIIENFA